MTPDFGRSRSNLVSLGETSTEKFPIVSSAKNDEYLMLSSSRDIPTPRLHHGALPAYDVHSDLFVSSWPFGARFLLTLYMSINTIPIEYR
jgi:hypothetical protein